MSDQEVESISQISKRLGCSVKTIEANLLRMDKVRPVVFYPEKNKYLYVSYDLVEYFFFSGEVHIEAIANLFEKVNGQYIEVIKLDELFFVQKKDLKFLVSDLES